ncbi:MAG: DUF1385 domain-containing protein [Candidatus Cloacimonetes bacterium]|nr:DUF1385 domain-containing protein [Candidatus Cloacimonadota bacterium]
MSEKKIQIGGQAVIEGVMMRGPDQIATALRRKDGSVDLQKRSFVSLTQNHRIAKLPIIRGFVSLVEMMIIGVKTLNFSAERYEKDYQEHATENSKSQKFQESMMVGLAFLFAFILFGYVPYLVSGMLNLSKNDVFFNLFAGSIRILFFVIYIYVISLIKDVRRVFEYHGAEHKAVFAHEKKVELTTVNVKPFTTLHPRCGTSFMFLVLLVAILIFSVIDTLIALGWGQYHEIAKCIFGMGISEKVAKLLGALVRLILHIPFFPLISGISYEIIKLSSRKAESFWVRIITGPGMALQKITTRPPDDSQIEIAIIALKAALNDDLSAYQNINEVSLEQIEGDKK